MLKVRKISKEFPYLFFESSLPMFISENFLSEIMNRYDFQGVQTWCTVYSKQRFRKNCKNFKNSDYHK